jgi:predicted hydrocarbon binding protein
MEKLKEILEKQKEIVEKGKAEKQTEIVLREKEVAALKYIYRPLCRISVGSPSGATKSNVNIPR